MNKTIAQQLNITDFPFEIKDKDGRLLYFENADNYWEIYEYDSDGNQTFIQNSDKYWVMAEYDSNGNQIYFENSDGKIIDDSAKEIITVNGIKYQRID